MTDTSGVHRMLGYFALLSVFLLGVIVGSLIERVV